MKLIILDCFSESRACISLFTVQFTFFFDGQRVFKRVYELKYHF